MTGIHDFWLFVLSAIGLAITPGPDTLYIVGQSISQGRRAGMLSVLGIVTGLFVHTTAAALGLSILLSRSNTAFTTVRWIGAAYLIYLGLRLLLTTDHSKEASITPPPPARPWKIYRQALASNLFNPKIALFFLAFLPQFVRADAPHRALSFGLLGIVFVMIGSVWSIGLAGFAAFITRALRESRESSHWLSRATGALFIGLGIRVIWRPALAPAGVRVFELGTRAD